MTEPDPLKQLFGIVTAWLWNRSNLSAEDVAARAHFEHSYLYLIRDGKRLPNPDIIKSLDGVLDADGLLVLLGNLIKNEGRRSRQGRQPAGSMEEAVRRRTVLEGLGALAAGTTGAAAGLEIIRETVGSTLVGHDGPELGIDEWAEVTTEYGRAYLVEPPEAIIADLAADVVDVQQRLDHEADESRRRDLSRIIGQLSALMALTLSNVGQRRAARRWWRTARQAADASGDTAVRVWVRGQESIRSLYEKRSPQVAVSLAEEALAIGGARYAGKALAAIAQGYAIMGRADEAQERLNEIEPRSWEGTAASLGDHESVFGWSETNYWHTATYVASHLGDVDNAERAQQEALKRYAPTDQRQRALLQMHGAMCAVRRSNYTDGLRQLHAVLEGLSQSQRTVSVLATGQEILEAVPASERVGAVVARLHELLALPAKPGGA
jgi:hypothetical protein